jgi:hypothetical protein
MSIFTTKKESIESEFEMEMKMKMNVQNDSSESVLVVSILEFVAVNCSSDK